MTILKKIIKKQSWKKVWGIFIGKNVPYDQNSLQSPRLVIDQNVIKYIWKNIPHIIAPPKPNNKYAAKVALLTNDQTAVIAGILVIAPPTRKANAPPELKPCSSNPDTTAGAA